MALDRESDRVCVALLFALVYIGFLCGCLGLVAHSCHWMRRLARKCVGRQRARRIFADDILGCVLGPRTAILLMPPTPIPPAVLPLPAQLPTPAGLLPSDLTRRQPGVDIVFVL